jgi:acyl-CoA reductase-like NAD-dependent aldehyde dehydrogenase
MLLPQYLNSSCFRIVNGAVEVVTALLQHPYGHIIYTGAGPVGSIVMAAASKFLTPVTLELGGKSPVIVTAKADIALAAKRIAWGKFFNAGQTCMCPDYALVEESVMPEFLGRLRLVSSYSQPSKPHMLASAFRRFLPRTYSHSDRRKNLRLRSFCQNGQSCQF